MAKRLEKKVEETFSDHVLASFTHGLLGGIHLLGVHYNFSRKKWRDVAIHGAIGAYDLFAAYNHYKKAKRAQEIIEKRYGDEYEE